MVGPGERALWLQSSDQTPKPFSQVCEGVRGKRGKAVVLWGNESL